MAEFVGLESGREIHLDSNLNDEPMEENNVDDQPTPIIKFPQTYEYVTITIKLCNGTLFGNFSCRCSLMRHNLLWIN